MHENNPPTHVSHCRRSAAEELVRSQFNAFRNMPSPGIQLERQFGRQTRHGGSTQSLNRMPDPAVPLNARNATSITDLVETKATPVATPQVAAVPAPKLATPAAAAEPVEPANVTMTRSKFAPANIFKNFFK